MERLLFLICLSEPNTGDHMFYAAPDEHTTPNHVYPVGLHDCYMRAGVHVPSISSGCVRSHSAGRHLLQKSFYSNNRYGQVCCHAAAIMHNSTQKEEAGWYSGPRFKWTYCMNIVVCVRTYVCIGALFPFS